MRDANLLVRDEPEMPKRLPTPAQQFGMVVLLMLAISGGIVLLAGF